MVTCIGNQARPRARPLAVEVLKISSEAPDRQVIDYAASFIRRGRVVAIPTDTVYGLCADPFNLAAIERVFRVKGRPESQALPILVNSVEQAITLIRDVPDGFLTLANKLWPGALTLVVGATHRLPLKVTGNTGNVALRWPDSRVATALIEAAGGPITGTSANLSGYPSCTTAASDRRAAGRAAAADSRFGRYGRHAFLDHRAHRERQLVRGSRRRAARIRNPQGPRQIRFERSAGSFSRNSSPRKTRRIVRGVQVRVQVRY